MEMAATVLESIDVFEKQLHSDLAGRIEEWSRCRQELTQWEEEHLLVESPKPAILAEHKKMVERLAFFGHLFSLLTSRPDFADAELAEMVHANLFILREKFQMFHNPMSAEKAQRILQEVFPEPRT